MAEIGKTYHGTLLLPIVVRGESQKKVGLSKAKITTIAVFIRSLAAILTQPTEN